MEYGIASNTLYNTLWSESRLNPNPPGHNDGNRACGVAQVHASLWGFDCDELKAKPEIGIAFLAKHIKEDTAWKYWTPLNCYTYVSHLIKLPKMSQIISNTSIPHVGHVAIFWYKDKRTGKMVKHIAYVSSVGETTFTVKEANFEAGKIGTRVVPKNNPNLAGFWDSNVI